MMSNPKKPILKRLLSTVVLIGMLLVGHYFFWYHPRAHDGRPDARSLAARLVLADEGLPYRVWLPYPHQNLSALERYLGPVEALNRASLELAGMNLYEIPSFGPFRLPPSREILLATNEDRSHVLMVARMYPLIRWLLRAAGAVAGNAWLSGGEVRVGDRDLLVRWDGGNWIASNAEVSLGGDPTSQFGRDIFAAFRVDRTFETVPAGLFSLEILKDKLLISSVRDRFRTRSSDARILEEGAAALILADFSGSSEPEKATAMVLFPPLEERSQKVPGAVVVHRGGNDRWLLPGEKVLSVVGIQPVTVRRGSWTIWAYDDSSLGKGAEFVPRLEALEASARTDEASATGEIDLSQAREAVRVIDSVLSTVPLIGREEARRWAMLSSLLDLMSEYSSLSYRIGETPDRLELIIE
jgi:hypothetical protein